jgi:hypothetical protein
MPRARPASAPSAPEPPALSPSPADVAPFSRSRVFLELGVVLCCALLGFVAVDLWVARLDSEQTTADTGLLLKDPALGFTNRPHFRNAKSHLDRHGLRSEEIPDDAPPGELRILGLGASQTYGAGGPRQEETWSYALEALLRRDQGASAGLPPGAPPVRVLNGGVMGYSLLQSCRRGLALLPLVDPDLVIVFVSPGRQSLLSRSGALRWERVGEQYVPVDVVQGLPGALRPLAASLHGLLSRSALYTRHRTLMTQPGEPDTSLGKFVLSRAPQPPEVEALLELSFGEAAALVEAARARGIHLRFLLYPEYEMSSGPAWERFLQSQAGRGAPPMGTPRDEPMEVLEQRLSAAGGECWSIFDLVSSFVLQHQRFIESNDHWTPAGHAAIGGALAELLARERLLERLAADRAARPR